MLKDVMRVVAGDPVVGLDTMPLVANESEVDGIRARAMARFASERGRPDDAERWLIAGLGDPETSFLTLFELCNFYWQQGRRERATMLCRNSGASAEYWLDQGYRADQRGDRAEALAYFQMAANVDPALIAAWQQVGHAQFAFEHYGEAIQAYERVLALAQSPTADVVHALGQAYLEMGNPTLARDVLDRGLVMYPNQRELYLVMAETYRREEDLATADGWYGRILQRWPDDAQTWANRAEVATAGGRQVDAVGYWQEATANQPTDVGYWLALADAAAAVNNGRLATDAYQQAMALRPDDPSIWLRAGRFLADTNRLDEARAAFEHVLAVQPANDEAAARLAELEQPSGE